MKALARFEMSNERLAPIPDMPFEYLLFFSAILDSIGCIVKETVFFTGYYPRVTSNFISLL